MGHRFWREPATMRNIFISLLFIATLAACASGDKFSAMRQDLGGKVEIPGWPALPKGVVGYNLYLAEKPEGPWEKINGSPISGGKTMVPYLEPGREYSFYLTSVRSDGVESKPSAPFKRKAVDTSAPRTISK
jgi:hypothetical protein